LDILGGGLASSRTNPHAVREGRHAVLLAKRDETELGHCGRERQCSQTISRRPLRKRTYWRTCTDLGNVHALVMPALLIDRVREQLSNACYTARLARVIDYFSYPSRKTSRREATLSPSPNAALGAPTPSSRIVCHHGHHRSSNSLMAIFFAMVN